MSSNSTNDESSPSDGKRQRTEMEKVAFTVSDDFSQFEVFTLSNDIWRRIPYLDKKINTTIGGNDNEDDRRRVLLPAGCSVDAFAALVRMLEPPNQFIEAKLYAASMKKALMLLLTADFLLMVELVPEIFALCRRNISTEEDMALLKSVPIASVQDFSSHELTGGLFVANMDVEWAVELAKVMCSEVKSVCDSQVRLLYDWLHVECRTEQDLEKPLNFLSAKCWFVENYSHLVLKKGASPWVQKFATLAAERPRYFRIFRDFTDPLRNRPTYKSIETKSLAQFVDDLLVPFRNGIMSGDGVKKILLSLLWKPCHEVRSVQELIYSQAFTTSELKFFLPQISKIFGHQAASILIHILIKSAPSIDEGHIDQLMSCSNWINVLTVPFLTVLEPELQLKVIRPLVLKLHTGVLPDDIQKFIEEALASRRL